MKKLTLLLTLVVATAATSFAQFRIGPKLGANVGKIDGAGFSEKYTLGYHVGGFAEIGLGKKAGIQIEALWNQITADTVSGFSAIYQNIDEQNFQNPQLNYFSVPLLFSYKPAKFLALQAGPQFGILLDRNKNLLQNGQEAFKRGDLSLLAGAQLNIANLRVYGRYAIGLNDISDVGSPNQWRTTGFQLGVGFAL
ncbi:MAG: porin family protein [Lacibacter sp.]|jgi:hypothetical protein